MSNDRTRMAQESVYRYAGSHEPLAGGRRRHAGGDSWAP
jgi:hypothetical protein